MRLSIFLRQKAPVDILHSVILFEIDVEGVTCLVFESDAPGSVNMDRVADRIEAGQRVKVISRQVYLGDLRGFINRIKTNTYALLHSLIDFGGFSGLEKVC
jgi:hypothetical protein